MSMEGESSEHLNSETSTQSTRQRRRLPPRKPSSDIEVITLEGEDNDVIQSTSTKNQKRKMDDGTDDDTQAEISLAKRQKLSLQSVSSCLDDGERPNKSRLTRVLSRKKVGAILKPSQLTLETRQAQEAEKLRNERIKQSQLEHLGIFMTPDSDKCERLVLAIDPLSNNPLIEVDRSIVTHLKLHQAEGVQFMFKTCFESVEMIEKGVAPGGCILAHCMGLGKTLQSIALAHTVLLNPLCRVKTVLILCPLNTATNWFNEFNRWIGNEDQLKIYKLYESHQPKRMASQLKSWQRKGGVGILHYEKFRILTDSKRVKTKTKSLFKKANEVLLNPGPDLVICDEGHILKNSKSKLSQSINQITTRRRIALTGTPLQNNLLEYHTMVDFVKPFLLGSQAEFKSQFEKPISRGQKPNATPAEVRRMQRRSHVLYEQVKGCVHRRDYSILASVLPGKVEYIVNIRLSFEQEELYKYYCDHVISGSFGDTEPNDQKLFHYYSELIKVWSNPTAVKKSNSTNGKEGLSHSSTNWWENVQIMSFDTIVSGKLVVLTEILKLAKAQEDKVLVFSQFLDSLDLIERLLTTWTDDTETSRKWKRGVNFFRIDGSTKADDRQDACNNFNLSTSKAMVFLISAKAGGLGINLQAANRVVLFDTSWNPSLDKQCIFRVYRYGQAKKCYVYRLVARGTMEEEILQGQIRKLTLSQRVTEEKETKSQRQSQTRKRIYEYVPEMSHPAPPIREPEDKLLGKLLDTHRQWIYSYQEFDSLLEEQLDARLSSRDKDHAWTEFTYDKAKQIKERVKSQPIKCSILPATAESTARPETNPYNSPSKENYAQIVTLLSQRLFAEKKGMQSVAKNIQQKLEEKIAQMKISKSSMLQIEKDTRNKFDLNKIDINLAENEAIAESQSQLSSSDEESGDDDHTDECDVVVEDGASLTTNNNSEASDSAVSSDDDEGTDSEESAESTSASCSEPEDNDEENVDRPIIDLLSSDDETVEPANIQSTSSEPIVLRNSSFDSATCSSSSKTSATDLVQNTKCDPIYSIMKPSTPRIKRALDPVDKNPMMERFELFRIPPSPQKTKTLPLSCVQEAATQPEKTLGPILPASSCAHTQAVDAICNESNTEGSKLEEVAAATETNMTFSEPAPNQDLEETLRALNLIQDENTYDVPINNDTVQVSLSLASSSRANDSTENQRSLSTESLDKDILDNEAELHDSNRKQTEKQKVIPTVLSPPVPAIMSIQAESKNQKKTLEEISKHQKEQASSVQASQMIPHRSKSSFLQTERACCKSSILALPWAMDPILEEFDHPNKDTSIMHPTLLFQPLNFFARTCFDEMNEMIEKVPTEEALNSLVISATKENSPTTMVSIPNTSAQCMEPIQEPGTSQHQNLDEPDDAEISDKDKELKRKASKKKANEKRRMQDLEAKNAGQPIARYEKDKIRKQARKEEMSEKEKDLKREEHKEYQRKRREEIQRVEKAKSAPTPTSDILTDDFLLSLIPKK